MENNISKVYEPQNFEKKNYEFWEKSKFFHADVNDKGEPYSIVIPPPNVTGQLHMGHALDETLQDILIRYHRMRGHNTLWMPGCDHAGIATQARVEESLRKEEGVSRYDLGREEFLKRVWAWKEKFGSRIMYQLRSLGSSCDWDRERFTMDEGCSKAVREVFNSLYEEGLIYRGTRITNWCPHCNTALSDIEVEHETEQGHLWHLRYPFEDGSGYVEVATTRPETMLGDTGVAVHPDDERYKDLVGKTLILPLVGRKIKLFADEYVDKEFGTGAVKVTPAHDPNDFEMGQRHNLEQIKVIDNDGTMSKSLKDINDKVAKYAGLDRYECRKQIVADLEAAGVLVSTEDHEHAVGHCQRCHTTVEPLISKQWFVKMDSLAKPAIEAVRDGRIKFVPDRFTKIYENWLENIRDWCISRQLWWGHRIPAWYCDDCGHTTVSREDVQECEHCHSHNIHQDEDVLDTWFSSALWPFETMGWPEQTAELKKFYPTSVLVTGYDIIFFWVARMVMMGLKFGGDVPFRYVFIHGLIRDRYGRKMSKSLGNGIDPVEIIDKFGADTLRFMLITGNTPGNDMRFYEERVESARNFANKIWNASRYLLMNLEGFDKTFKPSESDYTLADKWIISRLSKTVQGVTENLDKFELGEAGRMIYEFLWSEYCDWYIELTKSRLYGLEKTLRLLHPFMPFLTEEIWQKLPHEGESIMIAPWVKETAVDEVSEKSMNVIMETIKTIRNLRAEVGVQPKKQSEVILHVTDESLSDIIKSNEIYLNKLAAAEPVKFLKNGESKPEHALSGVVEGVEIFLPLAGLIDIEKETARLQKELDKLNKGIESTKGKLNNERFISKAPAEVVQAERDKLAAAEEKIKALESRIASFKF